MAETGAETALTRRLALFGGGAAAVLLALGLLLWARYGGAVFLEMMASAWAYCF